MSSEKLKEIERQEVHVRAGNRCEYCLLSEEDAHFRHEIDHIIAEKHGGPSVLENLALSCFDCNRFKGPNIASIDPLNRELAALFNPRTQSWSDHFNSLDGVIEPLTGVGRVMVAVLQLNLPARVEVRRLLTASGNYPG